MKNIAKLLLCGVSSALLGIGCSRSDKKFLITDTSVGNLTKEVKLSQLDSLYKNDSLVKTSLEGEFRYISDERFLVYEKGGESKQLLELTPSIPLEGETQHIQGVQIMDERFATAQHRTLTLNNYFPRLLLCLRGVAFTLLLQRKISYQR